MKAILRIGFLTVAAIVSMGLNVHGIQVSYTLNEAGGSGTITGGDPTELNERVEADLGTYEFSGSVLPDRVGLIGVRSGFRAAVSRFVPGFSPDDGGGSVGDGGGGESSDADTGSGGGPGSFPSTQWTNVTIDTSAAGTYQTLADINGLTATNEVGFVQFDWVVTGTSNIFLEAGTGLFGDVTVNDALSVAILRFTGDLGTSDTFIHNPTSGDSINDVESANLQADSFLVPFDFTQLAAGEIPQIPVDFEFAVETRLDITNNDDLGNFEALFDADFTNTATLTSVTVLDANLNVIPGASVVDSVTGGSLVAGAPVVEEEVSNQEYLADIAVEVGALADAATDPCDAYKLNVACYALNFAAKDKFYEEDGNRLSRRGCNVFNGAAYAICYLQHTGVAGTDEIVDRILEKLEQIVDDEIDYAIENGGQPQFIEIAEDFAELAEFIDEDLDNPVVAAIAYKLAWAHAFFATY